MGTSAFFSDECVIKLGEADVASTALTAVTAYVTNISESGGGRDTESISVFGGSNIVKEMPRSQYEVSMDVIIPPGSNATLWDSLLYESTLSGSSIGSDGEATAKKLELTWTSGSDTYARSYNDIYAFEFSPEESADDVLKGSITFKMSATNESGNANLTVTRS